MASSALDEWLREQSAHIARAQEDCRRFCEEQHRLAMVETQRAQKLGGWLDVIQAITVASLGASTATLLIALLSSAAACR